MEEPRLGIGVLTDLDRDQGFLERNGSSHNSGHINPSRVPDPTHDFPIQLNRKWRVSFDTMQWILERGRQGDRWRGSAYCVTRQALLRNIRERCGHVDPDALAEIESFPPWHPHRTRGAP
jgi:hypothetical protein